MSVRVVFSERAGSGKSLVVRRLCEKLLELQRSALETDDSLEAVENLCVRIPVYGSVVDQCAVTESLLHMTRPDWPFSRIFHLDVHPSVILVFI